jgi:hypothetical protein
VPNEFNAVVRSPASRANDSVAVEDIENQVKVSTYMGVFVWQHAKLRVLDECENQCFVIAATTLKRRALEARQGSSISTQLGIKRNFSSW